MDYIFDCFFEDTLQRIARNGLQDRQSRRDILDHLRAIILGCSTGQDTSTEEVACIAVVAAINFHREKKEENGGICLMGKYHNILYIGLRTCWDWGVRESATVCDLLSAIFSCENNFERIFLGAIFGPNAPHFIAGWRSDFPDQVENTQAMVYFLKHATSEGLKFEVKPQPGDPSGVRIARFVDVPIDSCGYAAPFRVAVQALAPDILLLLLRFGADPYAQDGGTATILSLLDKLAASKRTYLYEDLLCLQMLLRNVPMIDMTSNPQQYAVRNARYLRRYGGLLMDRIITREQIFGVVSLRHLCRCRIRDLLRANAQLPDGIDILPLPRRMHRYIDLTEELENHEVEARQGRLLAAMQVREAQATQATQAAQGGTGTLASAAAAAAGISIPSPLITPSPSTSSTASTVLLESGPSTSTSTSVLSLDVSLPPEPRPSISEEAAELAAVISSSISGAAGARFLPSTSGAVTVAPSTGATSKYVDDGEKPGTSKRGLQKITAAMKKLQSSSRSSSLSREESAITEETPVTVAPSTGATPKYVDDGEKPGTSKTGMQMITAAMKKLQTSSRSSSTSEETPVTVAPSTGATSKTGIQKFTAAIKKLQPSSRSSSLSREECVITEDTPGLVELAHNLAQGLFALNQPLSPMSPISEGSSSVKSGKEIESVSSASMSELDGIADSTTESASSGCVSLSECEGAVGGALTARDIEKAKKEKEKEQKKSSTTNEIWTLYSKISKKEEKKDEDKKLSKEEEKKDEDTKKEKKKDEDTKLSKKEEKQYEEHSL